MWLIGWEVPPPGSGLAEHSAILKMIKMDGLQSRRRSGILRVSKRVITSKLPLKKYYGQNRPSDGAKVFCSG